MGPFTVRSPDAPGTDLGSWTVNGNIHLPGFIEITDSATAPAPPSAGRCRIYSLAGQLTTVDGDGAPALLAAAVSTTTAGTISGTTAAGAAPTVTVTDATDQRGNFLLNPVTGGGGQAAGKVCTVRFNRAYTTAPGAVVLNAMNETDSTATLVFSASAPTTTGFDIYVGTALTTAKAYRVNYVVVP